MSKQLFFTGLEPSEYKRYELRTLEDFKKIPVDKLDDCLASFKQFIIGQEDLQEILKKKVAEAGIPEGLVTFSCSHFIWVDDGDNTCDIKAASEACDAFLGDIYKLGYMQ